MCYKWGDLKLAFNLFKWEEPSQRFANSALNHFNSMEKINVNYPVYRIAYNTKISIFESQSYRVENKTSIAIFMT